MDIIFYWLTMGPYHYARMNAIENVASEVNLKVIEACNNDDHNWKSFPPKDFEHLTLLPGKKLSAAVVRQAAGKLPQAVDNSRCDIFVNGAGYFHLSMIKPVINFKRNNISTVLWSESTRVDQPRSIWKEFLKRRVISLYDAAIVAGKKHQNYMQKLGMDAENIKQVGNVVDNDYYASNVRSNKRGFVYIGRFLPIKNISLLVRAYHRYRRKCINMSSTPLPLRLVGDGPVMAEIKQLIDKENISGITLTGMLQPEEVKKEYAKSSVLILPSISEPWGLVINEAMASGLAVVASDRCGANPELVEHGNNGYIFDPENIEELCDYMMKFSEDPDLSKQMGARSLEIIKQFSPSAYAEACYQFFGKLINK